MNKRFVSFIVLFTLPLITFSQSQFSGWLASFNTFKTGKKTSIHFDAQVRSNDELKQTQTVLLRPGFNFHVNKTITLTAGYAFISNRRTIGSVSDMLTEHRIWQQLIINQKIKKVSLAHRFRFEQRILPLAAIGGVTGDDIITYDHTWAGRLRYFARSIVPLTKQPAFTKGPFVALQNEVFVNVFGKDKVNGKFFDQNRAYLAVGYRVHPKADLEIGYLNQYVNGAGSAFTNNHVVQVAGYLRL
jgi:hypothetical protein